MDALTPLLAVSDGFIFFLMAGGFLSFIALLFFIAHKQAKKRTAGLAAVAEALDMRFVGKGEHNPVSLGLGGMALFKRGRSKKIDNLMKGAFADADCLLFDYRYTTGNGKNSSTHRQTVVAFNVIGAHLPEFTCKPEHFFHKFADMLGFKDINFDEYPNFSKRYRLNGEDEASVKTIFNQEVIELLETQAEQPWSVDGKGDWLVIFRAGKRIKPEECSQFLLDSTTLLNAMTLS